ncbi:hypothetical protein DFH09DRAFT_1312350 [Mycena vulgaris]|nr:hypothetical protein DFH09DRAFT_1312350 [Mycena vulgaris]
MLTSLWTAHCAQGPISCTYPSIYLEHLLRPKNPLYVVAKVAHGVCTTGADYGLIGVSQCFRRCSHRRATSAATAAASEVDLALAQAQLNIARGVCSVVPIVFRHRQLQIKPKNRSASTTRPAAFATTDTPPALAAEPPSQPLVQCRAIPPPPPPTCSAEASFRVSAQYLDRRINLVISPGSVPALLTPNSPTQPHTRSYRWWIEILAIASDTQLLASQKHVTIGETIAPQLKPSYTRFHARLNTPTIAKSREKWVICVLNYRQSRVDRPQVGGLTCWTTKDASDYIQREFTPSLGCLYLRVTCLMKQYFYSSIPEHPTLVKVYLDATHVCKILPPMVWVEYSQTLVPLLCELPTRGRRDEFQMGFDSLNLKTVMYFMLQRNLPEWPLETLRGLFWASRATRACVSKRRPAPTLHAESSALYFTSFPSLIRSQVCHFSHKKSLHGSQQAVKSKYSPGQEYSKVLKAPERTLSINSTKSAKMPTRLDSILQRSVFVAEHYFVLGLSLISQPVSGLL